MKVKYPYQRLLKQYIDDDPVEFDREAWFSLLSQDNIHIENKIWEFGHGLLKPYYYKKEENTELYSPLFLLIEIDESFVLRNLKTFSRWLNESVFQIKFSEDKNSSLLYNFYNKEQELIFYKLINSGLKKETYDWIKYSKLYPKPHARLEESDIRRIIFNNFSIKGLNTFSNDWGKDIWNKKWSFKNNAIEMVVLNDELLLDPFSFWPIECGTLHIDWLQSLLDKNAPTDMILTGLYNEKDIETITLRVLKISIMAFSNNSEFVDDEDVNISSKYLWLRREQHPLKALKILLNHNASIEGSWGEKAWWEIWMDKRKNSDINWNEWDKEILFNIDSLAERKKILIQNNQTDFDNTKNRKRI